MGVVVVNTGHHTHDFFCVRPSLGGLRIHRLFVCADVFSDCSYHVLSSRVAHHPISVLAEVVKPSDYLWGGNSLLFVHRVYRIEYYRLYGLDLGVVSVFFLAALGLCRVHNVRNDNMAKK